MGWIFRRSVRFGPLKVNFSKSGVGYSVGGRGFRTGVRADGRRYTSVGIPGTGISHMSTSKPATGTGCALAFLFVATAAYAAALTIHYGGNP